MKRTEYSYDELIDLGYEFISFTDKRLATISPKNHYDIFAINKNDLWQFYAREHSNYKPGRSPADR